MHSLSVGKESSEMGEEIAGFVAGLGIVIRVIMLSESPHWGHMALLLSRR